MKLGNVKINELDRKVWIKIALTLITYYVGMAVFFYSEHHMYRLETIINKFHVDAVVAEHGIAGICFAIVSAFMAIIFIIIDFDLLKRQYQALKHHFKEYLFWSVVGAVFVALIQFANTEFFHGPHHSYTSLSNQLAGVFSPFTIISMIVGVAFCEEIVYKVVCFFPVEELSPLSSGIVSALIYGFLNAFIFGLFLPASGVGAFLLYTCLGLKFAFLYSRTHTIYTSITAGAIYSFITIMLTLMSGGH